MTTMFNQPSKERTGGRAAREEQEDVAGFLMPALPAGLLAIALTSGCIWPAPPPRGDAARR